MAITLLTPDPQLVQAYVQGNEYALSLLLEKYQSKIYGFIVSKVQDSDIANDLFQDTFIKVIRTLKEGNYAESGKFLPWVMRIAHNLIIDHFRREKKMPKCRQRDDYNPLDFIVETDAHAEKQMVLDQIGSDLAKLIECLPDDQKQVLHMRLYMDMSFKDIAETTGVSINTALGRMRYAILNIRKMVEKNQIILHD